LASDLISIIYIFFTKRDRDDRYYIDIALLKTFAYINNYDTSQRLHIPCTYLNDVALGFGILFYEIK